jgi:beta-glucanase (GH16 family)
MMKKNTYCIVFLALFLMTQYSFSQVDVVYKDLVWSDEFSADGPVDASKWFHQTQLPSGGSWFNGEVQHYTNLTRNSSVSSGFLNIVAIKENYTNQGVTKRYTSARLNSKFAFKYGRVDVRAKVPVDQGTWPAVWLLGKNINEAGGYFDSNFGTTNWPGCGEIDIMEHGIFPSKPQDFIQSALHTPSSSGNTVNHGGTIASDLQNSYHVYSMNWSPYKISFLLDDVIFYTYNPAVKDASTWPFDKEQYLLLNIAMGGIAGNIPATFNRAAMDIDYVRVYQNTSLDTESPTNFTATVGAVTSSSVELLLNATDNSGNVAYNVTYGNKNVSFVNPSGNQKSAVISNLSPNTSYTFAVTASDLAGNQAANNPLVRSANTSSQLACSGTDTSAQQGSFSTGYKYAFETIGNDVKFTFELLDTDKVGIVAFLWNQSPFTEFQMSNVSGNTFTKTITGLTSGATINYACKFAYQRGLSVTKYFSYVVADNCSLGLAKSSETDLFFFTNPANEYVVITSKIAIDTVEIYDILGNLVISTSRDTNKVDIKKLAKGIYLLAAYSGTQKSVKKLIVE